MTVGSVADAEKGMAEYDLDGWTAPDLITPTDIRVVREDVNTV